MWHLVIALTILVHGAHKPVTEHRTISLAYPTEFTCNAASELIDVETILTAANAKFKAQKVHKWAVRVKDFCEPETNGQEPTSGWSYDNRMYRP